MGRKKNSRKIKSGNKRCKRLQKVLTAVYRCAMITAEAMHRAQIHAIIAQKKWFESGGMVVKQNSKEIVLDSEIQENIINSIENNDPGIVVNFENKNDIISQENIDDLKKILVR